MTGLSCKVNNMVADGLLKQSVKASSTTGIGQVILEKSFFLILGMQLRFP